MFVFFERRDDLHSASSRSSASHLSPRISPNLQPAVLVRYHIMADVTAHPYLTSVALPKALEGSRSSFKRQDIFRRR